MQACSSLNYFRCLISGLTEWQYFLSVLVSAWNLCIIITNNEKKDTVDMMKIGWKMHVYLAGIWCIWSFENVINAKRGGQ